MAYPNKRKDTEDALADSGVRDARTFGMRESIGSAAAAPRKPQRSLYQRAKGFVRRSMRSMSGEKR